MANPSLYEFICSSDSNVIKILNCVYLGAKYSGSGNWKADSPDNESSMRWDHEMDCKSSLAIDEVGATIRSCKTCTGGPQPCIQAENTLLGRQSLTNRSLIAF